jgi:hypothetical protein
MKKIALLLTLFAFLGSMAPGAAAGDRSALPLTEVPAFGGKDKDKPAKKDQKNRAEVSAPPAAATGTKSCCAKPSRIGLMGAKPSVPVKK